MDRKEAIKYVKTHLLDEKYNIEALTTLIPELKESEDEGIRKEIIQYIKDLNKTGNLTSEYSTGWIAWIEKQNHDGKKWTIYDDAAILEFTETGRHFILVVMTSGVPYQQVRSLGSLIRTKEL